MEIKNCPIIFKFLSQQILGFFQYEKFWIVVTFHFAALLEIQLHFQMEEQANHGNNYQIYN